MRNIKAYVESQNKFRAIFGQKPLTLNTADGRQAIAEQIDCELSPENLTCDGELSRSQVQARYTKLIKAARELKQLDPAVNFYEAV